jgi:hypothetical protein
MIPKSGYRFPACAKPVAWIFMLAERFGGRSQVGKRSCASKELKRDDEVIAL